MDTEFRCVQPVMKGCCVTSLELIFAEQGNFLTQRSCSAEFSNRLLPGRCLLQVHWIEQEGSQARSANLRTGSAKESKERTVTKHIKIELIEMGAASEFF